MNVCDLMCRKYHILYPATPIAGALAIFQEATEAEGRRIFGLMVTDDDGQLVGILSIYDILTLLQPKHIHIWGEMRDLDISGLIETMCRKCGELLVGDIMTTDIITVSSDSHIFAVLEIMIKHHIRRLPVIEGGRVVGIVYLSDLFFHLAEKIKEQGR
ncbi:MAG: HPP family protein [Desulfopila sp.]